MDGSVSNSAPDICIAYKLHLECGRLINLYDWLEVSLCAEYILYLANYLSTFPSKVWGLESFVFHSLEEAVLILWINVSRYWSENQILARSRQDIDWIENLCLLSGLCHSGFCCWGEQSRFWQLREGGGSQTVSFHNFIHQCFFCHALSAFHYFMLWVFDSFNMFNFIADEVFGYLFEIHSEEILFLSLFSSARFIRAVSELEFLGFIKSTKQKTDHVARLTWGGCWPESPKRKRTAHFLTTPVAAVLEQLSSNHIWLGLIFWIVFSPQIKSVVSDNHECLFFIAV